MKKIIVAVIILMAASAQAATLSAIRKPCTAEDFRDLLVQAVKYLPEKQGPPSVTSDTALYRYEKESAKLRRMAKEIEDRDEFLQKVEDAIDEKCD
jgi:hypothetical protein